MQTMNLEELKNHITKDAQLDDTELGKEATRTPQLHGKYINILADIKLVLGKQVNDLAVTRLRMWKIYTGKVSKEELEEWGEEPSDYTLLKTDIEKFIEADPKVIELKSKILLNETKLKMVEEFIKSLNNRNFLIKSAIDWFKMSQGIV
jgi:hypothetical protein